MTSRNQLMKTFLKIPLRHWSGARFEVPVAQGNLHARTKNTGKLPHFKIPMKTPLPKIHPALWLILGLAIVATSCATNVIRPPGDNAPAKGATLLMHRSLNLRGSNP